MVSGIQNYKGYVAETRNIRKRDRQIRQSRKEPSPPSG
jgi:hypothetical protein